MYSRRVPFHAVKYITNKFAFMTWQGNRSSRVHYQELCAPDTVSQKFCQWILRPKAQELSMDPQTQGRRSVHDRTNYFDKAFPIKPRLYLLFNNVQSWMQHAMDSQEEVRWQYAHDKCMKSNTNQYPIGLVMYNNYSISVTSKKVPNTRNTQFRSELRVRTKTEITRSQINIFQIRRVRGEGDSLTVPTVGHEFSYKVIS
jgi:hypothetical protein